MGSYLQYLQNCRYIYNIYMVPAAVSSIYDILLMISFICVSFAAAISSPTRPHPLEIDENASALLEAKFIVFG